MERPRGLDAGILAGCMQGQPEAWRSFVAAYHALVTAIFRKLLAPRGLPADARSLEDETSDFFADLCLNRERVLGAYRGDGSFDAFLAVVAANYIRSKADAADLEARHLQAYAAGLALQLPEDGNGRFDEDLIASVLRVCTIQERLLVKLLFVDGASAEEAGALLGTTRGAVYLRKHRLLAKVKELLEERSRSREGSPPQVGSDG